ncbi:YozE family protein [Streptomyces sp. NBC_01233]|uniref:YozE family protein n=1 Tax=Streptomyces sp. NBC_01233 TaxID=2903787 RepID=UPI002E10F23E|nr:YozE family protein [Streptomyces sp. NBC_01233]
MSNGPSDFRAWLMHHVSEQSAIGDLARDARDDDGWPTGEPESFELYNEYLDSMNASDGALDALEKAWNHYDEIRT